MKTDERIKAVEDRIKSLNPPHGREEILAALRGLLREGDGNFQETIRHAIGWADMYFSPRKSDAYGGREKVKSHLMQDLGTAREIARQLDGG